MTKINEKQIALEMRKNLKSLGEISRTLKISKSTVSLWCKDIKLSPEQEKLLRSNAQTKEERANHLKMAREASAIIRKKRIDERTPEEVSERNRNKNKRSQKTRNKYATKKRNEFKQKCVEYKGGSCKCGYNKCLAALEFHHRDPNEKDFSISSMMLTSVTPMPWELVSKELDKCDLLCTNCHREEHYKIIQEKYKI